MGWTPSAHASPRTGAQSAAYRVATEAPTSASPRPEPAEDDRGPLVVGARSRFEGVLAFRGRARIEGEVRGGVVCQGTLRIGPEGLVEGSIEADELILEGRLRGDAVARNRIELAPTARVTGSIRAPRVLLADGCVLNGRCETPRSSSNHAERGDLGPESED